MNFIEDILLDPVFIRGEDFNRLDILRSIMAGYNNKHIADQLSFSVKNIENIISKFLKKAGIDTKSNHHHLITPRVRLLVHGLQHRWLGFKTHNNREYSRTVTRQQYATLMMCAVGCSNQAMADILYVSAKAIESRLNNLFNQFGLKSKQQNDFNPRMALVYMAISTSIIRVQDIVHLSTLLDFEAWEQTIASREQIYNTIENYQYQKYQYLHEQDNIQNIYSYIQQTNYAGEQTASPNLIQSGS